MTPLLKRSKQIKFKIYEIGDKNIDDHLIGFDPLWLSTVAGVSFCLRCRHVLPKHKPAPLDIVLERKPIGPEGGGRVFDKDILNAILPFDEQNALIAGSVSYVEKGVNHSAPQYRYLYPLDHAMLIIRAGPGSPYRRCMLCGQPRTPIGVPRYVTAQQLLGTQRLCWQDQFGGLYIHEELKPAVESCGVYGLCLIPTPIVDEPVDGRPLSMDENFWVIETKR